MWPLCLSVCLSESYRNPSPSMRPSPPAKRFSITVARYLRTEVPPTAVKTSMSWCKVPHNQPRPVIPPSLQAWSGVPGWWYICLGCSGILGSWGRGWVGQEQSCLGPEFAQQRALPQGFSLSCFLADWPVGRHMKVGSSHPRAPPHPRQCPDGTERWQVGEEPLSLLFWCQ